MELTPKSRQHSCLSLAQMWENLKQEDSVDKYINAHDKIRTLASNKVEANHGLVCHLFLRNLKPGVARFIRNKDCATIEDAYCKACNAKQKMKLTSNFFLLIITIKTLITANVKFWHTL